MEFITGHILNNRSSVVVLEQLNRIYIILGDPDDKGLVRLKTSAFSSSHCLALYTMDLYLLRLCSLEQHTHSLFSENTNI